MTYTLYFTISAKLENNVFIPALVLGTFINNFTVTTMKSAWKILLFSLAIEIPIILISNLLAKTLSKDTYERKIYTYGLCFSNFGFMGNAVVSSLFPEHFTTYLIFTLALWGGIYLYAMPALLLPTEHCSTMKQRLKSFVNPIIISVFAGMLLGIVLSSLDVTLPKCIADVITVSGNCMSPVAMILTGITIAEIDIKKVLRLPGVYIVTFYRLLLYPLTGMGLFFLFRSLNIDPTYIICTVCSLAMPLGLNTIVVPSAYGKDTSIAAGMALVSHLISVLTIPLVFMLLNTLI